MPNHNLPTDQELAEWKRLQEDADHDCECGVCDYCEARAELADNAVSNTGRLIIAVEELKTERDALYRDLEAASGELCKTKARLTSMTDSRDRNARWVRDLEQKARTRG